MTVSSVLTNKKVILALLLISIAMALLSLFDRQIGTDDAWFAEQSYWFDKNGYVRSNLFDGLNNFGKEHLAYHRLHVWQGGFMIKLFGWSEYSFKAIMLAYFLVFLLAAYAFFKKSKLFTEQSQYLLFYTLAITHSVTVFLLFTNRPEIMIMTFGFSSFSLLFFSLKKHQMSKVILSAVFAGLAVLTHLNGLIFVVAGAVLLLSLKNYRHFWYFSVTSFLVSLLYFMILQDMNDVRLYLQQMQFNPALKGESFSVWGIIIKLLNSYIPYFHKGSDASYTFLFAFTFWWFRKEIFKNEVSRNIFVYFVSVAVTLAVISPGFKDLYLVYHAPYAFLLIALLYKDILTLSVVKQRAFAALLVLFFLTQWGETVILMNKKTPGLSDLHARVSQSLGIERGDRIVAPITYVFNEIDKFNIKVLYAYQFIAEQKNINLKENFFKMAFEDQRKYLIFKRNDLKDLKIEMPVEGQKFGEYEYQGRYGPYYGFKLLKKQG